MIKTWICAIAVVFGCGGLAIADETTFLRALTELPPKFLADIPLANRGLLIAEASKDPARMDARKGWLHWYSDGGNVKASSMIWAKELPREMLPPLIFVHMAKPFADGRQPDKSQTFVLERGTKGWVDVTQAMIPAEMDLTQHFRTRKEDALVEVAQWIELKGPDGGKIGWNFGPRFIDLHWTGERFIAKKPESHVLTRN